MSLKLLIPLICVVLGIAAPVGAQEAGEQLFVPPPKGWGIVYHDLRGGVELTELVPSGQSAKDWSEMLAVRIVSGKTTKTPQDLLKDQYEEIQSACENVGAGPISPAADNGYDAAMRAIACPKSKDWGKGELALYKVIRGRDRIYVVSRAWRGAPFEKDQIPIPAETTKLWLAFMEQVVLCDAREPKQHPCPAPKP